MSFVVSRINMVIIFMEMNTTDRYSERIRYDKNSNVSNVARYGMNNLRSYGVIDSLEITRNGNQLVAIEDHAEKDLTYTGASDFVDGTDLSEEYTYDGNNDVDWDSVLEEAIRLGGGEVEKTLINGADNGGQGFGRRSLREKLITPPSVVEEYASRLIYIHGKMQWINEDCTSDEIDYPRYMRALVKGGYKGYISSEFEGQRSVPHTLNEVMFVNRQHQLMRKCLAECEAEGL